MAHIGVHKGRVKRRINGSRDDIRTGMIMELTYTRQGSGETRTSMYLIVDSMHKGSIHALDLDEVPLVQLKMLAKKYTVNGEPSKADKMGVPYTKLSFKLNSKQLYEQALKNKIVTRVSNNYKLLKKLNLRKVTIIDYDWN